MKIQAKSERPYNIPIIHLFQFVSVYRCVCIQSVCMRYLVFRFDFDIPMEAICAVQPIEQKKIHLLNDKGV